MIIQPSRRAGINNELCPSCQSSDETGGLTIAAPLLDLSPGDVHLWFVFTDQFPIGFPVSTYLKCLSRGEQERMLRYKFERHRCQYLVTRALVRSVLSRYAPIDPCLWRFTVNKYGRPEVESTAGFPSIRFNVSHTEGMIVCVVALHSDLGVDVENVQCDMSHMDVARRFFSKLETKALESLPCTEMIDKFYQFWTLKESYLKAKSMGLSLPLDWISFANSRRGAVNVWFDPLIRDDPAVWMFRLLYPSQHQVAAVSVRCSDDVEWRLAMRKVVPFASEESFSCDVLGC